MRWGFFFALHRRPAPRQGPTCALWCCAPCRAIVGLLVGNLGGGGGCAIAQSHSATDLDDFRPWSRGTLARWGSDKRADVEHLVLRQSRRPDGAGCDGSGHHCRDYGVRGRRAGGGATPYPRPDVAIGQRYRRGQRVIEVVAVEGWKITARWVAGQPRGARGVFALCEDGLLETVYSDCGISAVRRGPIS